MRQIFTISIYLTHLIFYNLISIIKEKHLLLTGVFAGVAYATISELWIGLK